ncbi:FUSC family protein [Maridesulfovibrio ferrireducens]|uniref:FUSC family protein n=1 Tax=Maridesulfovibrio ferrireducens TaxID=246191 RepID=UPI001A2AFB26|nr:FUSC family protein [Maridesulfovibrio ferrireducens]MBI9112432.1 FUSC family protein [Maridesulfovibrio ferrireducens]
MFKAIFGTLRQEFRLDSIPFQHAVRAALAITIAVVASKFLDLRHAIWLPVSVIVVMRPSVGGTLRIGWRRLWGTVLGAALGVGILFLNPANTVLLSLIALSFFLVILLRVFSYTAFSCALTAGIILLLGMLFTDGWQFGLERILDTVLGVGIGIAASFGVWPNMARKNLRKKMFELVHTQAVHFEKLTDSYLHDSVSESDLVSTRIDASIKLDQCSEIFREAAAEPGLRGWQRDNLTRLIRVFTRMHRLLTAMSTIIRRGYGGPLSPIADGMKNILQVTQDHYAWLECYALHPDECKPVPDFEKAVNDFIRTVGDARIRGDFEDVPLERRNNISAFIWNIRSLGAEIDRAGRRLHELRHGRESNLKKGK